jgi:branched-chain amino acid transport system permease protein
MEYVQHLIVISLIYAMLAMSYNLIVGYCGLLSMGHAAFFGLGAYTSALTVMHLGTGFLVGVLAAILSAAILSAIIAVPALRVKDEYLVVLTLSINVVVYGIAVIQIYVTGGTSGLIGIPGVDIFGLRLKSTISYIFFILSVSALCFAVLWRITRSPFGRVLKAMRDDEVAIRMLGKDILKYKVWVFVIGGVIASVAGSLFAHYSQIISPPTFSVDATIFIMSIVIIGGLANLWGSVIAAFLLIFVPEILTFIPGVQIEIGAIRMIIFGLLLVVFVRFRPRGLIPEYTRLGFRNNKLPTYVAVANYQMQKSSGLRETSPLTQEAQRSGDIVLETKELAKFFGGISAVDNVSLVLPKGKITALIGPNGAGKTTIFNLITGFIRPDHGRVFLRGRDITSLTPHRVSSLGIARSFQEVRFFGGMSVFDNVLVAMANQSGEKLGKLFFRPWKVAQEESKNRQEAAAYLKFVGLDTKARALAKDLSFAEQKSLAMACMLSTGAEVLLIDELVSGIDPALIDKEMEMIQRLASMGKTVCIIEHNLDVVKNIADFAYFLAEGQVIATGVPAKLMADPKLAELYFGA